MQVHDLGTLAVEVGGVDKTFGRSKQAILLSILVLHANRRIALDELVDVVWGGQRAARATVDSAVWRLRQSLTPTTGFDALTIEYDSGGYRLVVDPRQVDSSMFEAAALEAQALLRQESPQQCLTKADQALDLWRGRPYEWLADVPAAAAAVARLEELNGQVHETRIAALISLGDLEQALADLEPLLVRLPFREHLWAQRMTALAGRGRTEEALSSYQRLRTLLADETGMDPGPELRELHQQILAHNVTATPTPTAAVPAGRMVHLPRRSSPLIGREADTERLGSLILGNHPVTITGPGGTGKTRLAVEIASQVADVFPDGVWFVDLTMVTDPEPVVDVVISTLGLGAGSGTDALAALNTFLHHRRVLLVFDNCEHVLNAAATLIEEITADAAGPTVLATSREPLATDSEVIWTLAPLPVSPDGDITNSTSPAAQLFLDRAAQAAPQLDLSHQLHHIEAICYALDGLPLAVELAAARVRAFTLTEIKQQVTADPSRLARIGRGGARHHADLDATIEWSYRLLKPAEQAAHRHLSVLARPFTLDAAQAVLPSGSTTDTADLLSQLTHRSLLTADPDGDTGPSTFSQLATVRAHAGHRLRSSSEAAQAVARRDRWALNLLAQRPRLGHPNEITWCNRLEQNYATVRLAMNNAVETHSDPSWLLLGGHLQYFWYLRSRLVEGTTWLQSALDVWIDQVSPVEAAKARLLMAMAYEGQGWRDRAAPLLQQALPGLATDLPEDQLIGTAEILLGLLMQAWAMGDTDAQQLITPELAKIIERSHDDGLKLHSDAINCVLRIRDLDPRLADQARSVYQRARRVNNTYASIISCIVLTAVAQYTGDLHEAELWAARTVRLNLRAGASSGGLTLETLANIAAVTDAPERAARTYAASQYQAARGGLPWPRYPKTGQLMNQVKLRLGDEAYTASWNAGEHQSLREIAGELKTDPAAPVHLSLL